MPKISPHFKDESTILAGDIGGTKANIGLFSVRGNDIQPVCEKSFICKNYAGLEPILKEFLTISNKNITAASFGIAGTIYKGKCHPVNLPWTIEIKELRKLLNTEQVFILNDLEANAWGISKLSPDEFEILNDGIEQEGNAALIAAGTGLGESILFWDGTSHIPFATEGGHTDFAPQSTLETELSAYLVMTFGHVSYERIVSGPGLHSIYLFLKGAGHFGSEPEGLSQRLRQEEPAAVISELALSKESELCEKALDIFVSIFGAEAGNLALKALAVGGIYLGGGIAPKIIEKLKDGTFLNAFTSKGRLSNIVSNIPVKVILNDKTALIGAAYFATQKMRVKSPG
ncbi:MAG: glucokinase [Thermodesulfobacteriota bacterium]